VDPRARLHRARVEKNIDLSRISALTALSPLVVRRIDEGRFEELPGGLYARSYIRAFAEAVGLRGDQVLREVETLLPGAQDPLPVLREHAPQSPAGSLLRSMRGLVPALPALPSLRSLRRVPSLPGLATLPSVPALPRLPSLPRLTMPLEAWWGVAVAIDVAIVAGVCAGQTALAAWTCGVGVQELLVEGGLALWATLLVPALLYWLVFAGIGRGTPGRLLVSGRLGVAWFRRPSDPRDAYDAANSLEAFPSQGESYLPAMASTTPSRPSTT
jgi:hypothetical protein